MTTFEFQGGLSNTYFILEHNPHDLLYGLLNFKILYQIFCVQVTIGYILKMKTKIPIENVIANGSKLKNSF
jgi:hypothetical protein